MKTVHKNWCMLRGTPKYHTNATHKGWCGEPTLNVTKPHQSPTTNIQFLGSELWKEIKSCHKPHIITHSEGSNQLSKPTKQLKGHKIGAKWLNTWAWA